MVCRRRKAPTSSFRILFEKRPSPYAGDRNNLRNPAGGRPPKPHKARPGGRTHGNTQKGPKGGGQTPPGAKKLHWPRFLETQIGALRRLQTKGLRPLVQMSNFYLRVNTNVPNGKRNVAYGHSKNQGPSALGTKLFSIRNKNAHTHHSVFQNWGLERDHKTKQP